MTKEQEAEEREKVEAGNDEVNCEDWTWTWHDSNGLVFFPFSSGLVL
jgi:hypothetical protein